jgi:hypothetical protein
MSFAKNFQEIMKKKITLGRLVDESFVPATQQPSNPASYIEDCRILRL